MKCLRSRRTTFQKVFLLLLIMICLMYLRIGMAAAEESMPLRSCKVYQDPTLQTITRMAICNGFKKAN